MYIKFVDWIYWGNAGKKLEKDIDFNEHEKYEALCQRELAREYYKLRNQHREKHGNLDDFKFDIKTFKMPAMDSLELLPLDELEKKEEE